MKYIHHFYSQFSHFVKKNPFKYIIVIIGGLLLLENTILVRNNLQETKPIFGLRFEGYNITTKNKAQIEQLISQEADKRNRPLLLEDINHHVYPITQSQIGYAINSTNIAEKLLTIGRQGNIWQKFIIQNTAIFGLVNEKLHGTYSQGLLTLQLLELQQAIEQNPQPISLDFTNDFQKILPPKNGVKIHVSALSYLVVQNIENPPSKPIRIPTYTISPTYHNPHELDPMRTIAQQLIQQPITITSGGYNFTLTSEDLKKLLTILERPDPLDSKKIKLVLRLDDTKLNQKLDTFAAKVESVTHAEFDDDSARTAIYSQFYSQNRFIAVIPTGRNMQIPTKVLGASDKPGKKTIYLTFDDGPNTIYHPLILDILKIYHVPATFFLIGNNVTQAADIAKRTFTDGHVIGNHSLTHTFLPKLSSENIVDELQKTNAIIMSINNNQEVKLFRPPYGGTNQFVYADAENAGLKLYLWDIDPRDWTEPPTDELVNRVVSNAHDGADVLFHSNHLATVKALPEIIKKLRTLGYVFKQLQ